MSLETHSRKLLNEYNCRYNFNKDTGIYELGFNCDKFRLKQLRTIICVHEDDYRVYGISNLCIDLTDSRLVNRVMEYICRVNDSLANGAFTLNFTTGLISFKLFVQCSQLSVTSQDLSYNLVLPIAMFDKFGNGLLEIVYSDANVKETYESANRAGA